MPLYVKALGIDMDRNLVSCHGGNQIWEFRNPRLADGTPHVQNGKPQTVYVDADPVTVAPGGEPCRAGALHALRVRDLPHWLGLFYAVVDMPDAKISTDKVYGDSQRIVRVADFDGLKMLEDFAQWCGEQGEKYSEEAAADFIASQFPDGFLDGVER